MNDRRRYPTDDLCAITLIISLPGGTDSDAITVVIPPELQDDLEGIWEWAPLRNAIQHLLQRRNTRRKAAGR